ncbi:hypothetical protein TNIN_111351 [Trichonephila inaurata madagascariensis]|uniref:Uncharacterized protein n=1 Tax=Trichonephila inaurata madagascariensis TaxID=2747483 RepID=A0A8X6X0H2_9ARAC|nr:hypothetical protein TNIN_111351 [Trichonephila inaurata madagascariensis]
MRRILFILLSILSVVYSDSGIEKKVFCNESLMKDMEGIDDKAPPKFKDAHLKCMESKDKENLSDDLDIQCEKKIPFHKPYKNGPSDRSIYDCIMERVAVRSINACRMLILYSLTSSSSWYLYMWVGFRDKGPQRIDDDFCCGIGRLELWNGTTCAQMKHQCVL